MESLVNAVKCNLSTNATVEPSYDNVAQTIKTSSLQ